VLKNNITATVAELKPAWWYRACIVIAASFVTIDLSGYLITGPGRVGGTVGIAQDSQYRVGDVVENGSITGFAYGVAFAGRAHTIQGVNASSNGWEGIDLEGTSSTVKDVNASNNGYAGIYAGGQGNRLIGNTANYNGNVGIEADCPNLLLENMAYYNPSDIVESGCVRQENFPAP
jgi:parallel beta-helix repeat protein